MLVLTRRVGEVVRIGHGITVTVTRVRNREVQLSINAPEEVPVSRGENDFRTADHERFDEALLSSNNQ